MKEDQEKERAQAQNEDEQVICSNELLIKIRERMAQRRKENPGEDNLQLEDLES